MASDARRLQLQRIFIAALALALSAVFVWMIRDFLGALFLAAILAMFLMPVQRWLSVRMARKGQPRTKIAASLLLILSVFLILLPLMAVLAVVAQQAVEVGQTALPWLQEQIRNFREEGLAGLPDWVPFKDAMAPYQTELASRLSQLASGLGGALINGLTRATGGALGFALGAIVFLFALFYLLTAGETSLREALKLLPMRASDRQLLAERTLSTIRATVKGTFVIALIQGTLTGGALAIAGVPGAVFWGAVAGLISIIPAIGTPLVWGPAAVWLFMSGSPIAAGAVALFGAVVIMNVDNVLRPTLVGKDAKMSDLMVLLSTLGGLTLFGFIGLVIGPVIAALFTSVWFIYARTYEDLLREDEPPQADPPA
ncbi:AI-2E family transporter [Alkalicaulis satelles]|uniref:AI-2E family transporter n=1 Tax=Alkalicaulis satelles TaxID=2609175 RepID=A0A5M6ZMB4_9PROT|nr:AI-2E family transporter [Alkalicaulis satelles]KAA5804844.1 AI-2E family transporter [Alkalicaulis satelles]